MKNLISIFLLFVLLSVPLLSSAEDKLLVPANFVVPKVLENKHFRIRTLTVNDVIKDYDAVMSSSEHLKGVFGSKSTWPSKDLSLEQNLIDLGWHQKEFQIRHSFAYTVVTLDESRVIGCIYIHPTGKGEFDADITMWVREDVVKDGYDDILFKTVKEWIANDWPLENPAYPGRDISWDEWEKL